MTAIAGICSLTGEHAALPAIYFMLEAQAQYGSDGEAVAVLGHSALGRRLFKLVPEDGFDRGPLVNGSRGWALVADARVDNRTEILRRLGYPGGYQSSDADLLFHAYNEWGDHLVDHVIGDFAIAVWSDRNSLLTLIRDPVGQRPLHYHLGAGFVAFASMPSGLHALPYIPKAADRQQLAGFVADIPRSGPATFFEGIRRVEPGCLVKIGSGGVSSHSYWKMPERQIYYPKQADYVEAFRTELDLATKVRLRGAEGLIGSHLSAGLDSSAVAATAARLMAMDEGKVIAFTAAPRSAFCGPVPSPRLADESGPAALVAAQYANMEHVIVRSLGVSPLDLLKRDQELFQEPIGFPCNHVWWSAINDAVRDAGIRILLTGAAGNLTMSAGGIPVLADFVQAGRLSTWWREAKLVSRGAPTWRGILATSFGPWIPSRAWKTLIRLAAPQLEGADDASFLRAEVRNDISRPMWARARGGAPERDDRRQRWKLLQNYDPGNYSKALLGKWGIDDRDPTSDRRLAEFCFSLPSEQLLGGGMTRRLARLALSDRLPNSLIHGQRGYQYADWYEELSRERLERAIDDLQRGRASGSVVDFAQLRNVAQSWPSGGWETWPVISVYRMALFRALSAEHFASRACQ